MLSELNTYDCTPRPKHEGLAHKTARVIHNMFHPHHKQHFLSLIVVPQCHAPEMETVTVTAVTTLHLEDQDDDGRLYHPPGGEFPYEGYAASQSFALIGVHGHAPHVSAPEPHPLALLLPVVLLVIWRTRRTYKAIRRTTL